MAIPYKSDTSGKKEQIAGMFNNIAHRYDFLNHFLSLGIDKLWRKKVIRLLSPRKPQTILDVATGTADLAIAALPLNPLKITGIDISTEMLRIGKEKVERLGYSSQIELLVGDSENLPFQDEQFDAITVAFGVRNFENLEKGLSEMFRVLKSGGTCLVLEFSKPDYFPVKQLYLFYFMRILPGIGKLFSKDDSAYSYLPESVNEFPSGEAFLKIVRQLGFKNTRQHKLSLGIASIYYLEK
jgi:demethylmenaquinone methyltransferase / 2-methoxy-6-polyprenyl-1,4-benzoquinol methylase